MQHPSHNPLHRSGEIHVYRGRKLMLRHRSLDSEGLRRVDVGRIGVNLVRGIPAYINDTQAEETT